MRSAIEELRIAEGVEARAVVLAGKVLGISRKPSCS
jgi:hypothetical protein